jgi:hypothetical protein
VSVGGMTTPMMHFHTHLAPSDHARLQRFSKASLSEHHERYDDDAQNWSRLFA